MTEISSFEFIELLNSNLTDKIENYSVQGDSEITVENITYFNRISNCHFNGNLNIRGYNRNEEKEIEASIIFENCIFEKNVEVWRCNFETLKFSLTRPSGEFFGISECIIDNFEIITSDIYSQQFSITHNVFKTKFHLSGVNGLKSNFTLRHNQFPIKEDTFYRTCFIANCTLINCDVYKNDFGTDLRFTNNKLGTIEQYSNNFFKNCIFRKATFYQTDFGASTTFKECKFEEPIFFEKIQNEQTTNLEFSNCSFKASASFKKSRIHYINFKICVFEGSAFFQDTYFNLINIDSSIFEKVAFFDNVQIKKIYNCDRRTIRNIKLHLQKSENKIDYNKFRVYEFEAYKKDLKKNIKQYKDDKHHFYHRKREIKTLKRDLFILNITSLFSEYGTDWKRALKCTIALGMFMYSLLYIFEFYIALNLDTNKNFWVGAFRFFLVTDFHSPFSERQYLNDSFSWIIFVLGKIFIAFGIYEMIQAFRKFKT